jgi:hypothetical protein
MSPSSCSGGRPGTVAKERFTKSQAPCLLWEMLPEHIAVYADKKSSGPSVRRALHVQELAGHHKLAPSNFAAKLSGLIAR